jgi:predicted extracellular nuclease
MKKFQLITALFLLLSCQTMAQKQTYKVSIIGFYNLENFYDTLNNTMVDDEEFLPTGPKNYNSKTYWDKVKKLATVIADIGKEVSADGPAILGVAEIENDTVLHDLVKHELIADRNYQIVHFDSRDLRGVDVGLLYNPKYFRVLNSKKLFVALDENGEPVYTRDILYVQGIMDGDTINVFVNHWPSRRGGEERSAPRRAAAAKVVKTYMDSIQLTTPNAKVIIMGDLNDDPISPSVKKVLNAKGSMEDVQPGGLYNPWLEMYKNGIGTLAYQDAWGLFDQILMSFSWLDKAQNGYFFFNQRIYNKEYLVENIGKYKGYPMRTWDGNFYRGGYSDHFPTFLIMLKKI